MVDGPPEPELVIPTRGGSAARGRWVVIGMLLLGMISTGIIWTYWKYRLTPYVPLRKALGQAFPKSSPRAEGGPTRNSPPLLMISIDVDFPPLIADPRVPPTLRTIVEIARANHDLSKYELFEVYLSQRIPERAPVRLKARWLMKTVLESRPDQLPVGEITNPQ
jgi:hypothetical protein